jgi:hypothetical protein
MKHKRLAQYELLRILAMFGVVGAIVCFQPLLGQVVMDKQQIHPSTDMCIDLCYGVLSLLPH